MAAIEHIEVIGRRKMQTYNANTLYIKRLVYTATPYGIKVFLSNNQTSGNTYGGIL